MFLRATQAVAFTVLLAAVSAGAAGPASTDPSTEALALCRAAGEASGGARADLLAHGLRLAESAIAADRADPTAHFALFCNLGRKLEGGRVGFGALAAVRRLRRAIDTAIALDPLYVDALVGKAGLLMGLPRLLGGSRDRAEEYLLRALSLQPDHPVAHLYLAEVLAARGVPATTRVAAR